MSMRDLILRKIMEDKFRTAVKVQSNVPKFVDVYKSSQVTLQGIIDTSNLPSIGFKTDASAAEYNSNMETIQSWLQIAAVSMAAMVDDYELVTTKFRDLSKRIFNESQGLRNEIDRITNMYCVYIPPTFANQTINSIVGKIGNYITLPFYIRTAKMYDGSAFVRVTSPGDIIFSNINRIKSVPMPEQLAIKVASENSISSATVRISVADTKSNLIYFNLLNNVLSTKLTLTKDNVKVYERSFNEAEVLANFKPVTFDTISIEITYSNTNTSKPFGIHLDSVQIFKELQFAKDGQFESNPFLIGNASAIEDISLKYDSLGDPQETKVVDLLSVSSGPSKMSYNRLDTGAVVDVSVYKFRHAEGLTGLTANDASFPEVMIAGKRFFSLALDEENEDLWNINYEQALVFHGLNQDYAETVAVGPEYYAQHFENWTKAGTYWKSMIYVTDDEAWIDIGQNTCLINGREFTGKFKMPKGISSIEVHEKDMDFRFGKAVVNDLSLKGDIYGDPLFPFNFAYIFAGLPEYDANGDIESKLLRRFDIVGTTTLFLDESFIPLSLEVKDTVQVEPYKLQLTPGVTVPGTYSIEPYSGKVKVYPMTDGDVRVEVKYRRASLLKRPVGVMFNRLLTFMPTKALMGLQNASEDQDNYKYAFNNEAFFTIDGNTQSKTLLLQNTSDEDTYEYNNIQHSQIIFNRLDENLYVSVKLDMETGDRYLTPVVKDIYLSMG